MRSPSPSRTIELVADDSIGRAALGYELREILPKKMSLTIHVTPERMLIALYVK